MDRPRTLFRAITELWGMLSRRRRAQFYALLAVMVAASFAEVFSLGTIVPFLAALTAPDRVLAHPFLRPLLSLFPGMNSLQLVLGLAAVFCIATLVAGAVRVFLLYVNTGFSSALGADLSLEVYRRTLYQPYEVHIGRNTSEVISGVTWKTNALINNIIGQLLNVASSVIIFLGIIAALFAIDPVVTISSICAFAMIYGLILLTVRRLLRRDSEIVARESTLVIKALQEGLGGIRDVLIDGTQEVFSSIYRLADRSSRAAQGRMTLAAGSPRFLVESLGMIFIALLAVTISRAGQEPNVVPVLGALALGAQRLLPIAQQGYASIITIRGNEGSLWDVLDLLRQPLPAAASETDIPRISFARQVQLRAVEFSYKGTQLSVLRHIDLVIPKGARIGIYGPTGGGKSTLLDIIMGLLMPTEGALFVDDTPIGEATVRGWQRHIAHVPQSIYLTDGTVAENIAFGAPPGSVDMNRVVAAAERAQIAAAIDSWPERYLTRVGERGVRLSGGQRQRLGIARALYKEADVIVLDEATSALDTDTEVDLMEAIEGLSHDLTIVMVAHRLTTLQHCDTVVEIAGGRIGRVGSYADMIYARSNE